MRDADAFRGQRHRTATAVEQGDAEIGLQLMHLHADGGVAEANVITGRGKAAVLANRVQ